MPYGIIAEFETAGGHPARGAEGARRWLHALGCVYAVPGARHGRRDGDSQLAVGWFSFLGGATGYTSGMLMVWYMNAYDYPHRHWRQADVQPVLPRFVPSFELTILLGAFGAVLGMLFLNRLPRLHHPLLKNRRFAQVTHDKFFIVIECDDPKYPEAGTRKLLEEAGSRHIELVEE